MSSNRLGQYLRELREEKGLSCAALGRELGFASGRSYISMLETGARYPNLKLLKRITDALGGDFRYALELLLQDLGLVDNSDERYPPKCSSR